MFYADLLYDYSLCVGLGYLILYTFVAFMFWINCMAVNIFVRFSAFMPTQADRQSGGVAKYLLYAQGAPLLVCITVYILDKYGDCGWTLPKMGHAQCFLGDYASKLSDK